MQAHTSSSVNSGNAATRSARSFSSRRRRIRSTGKRVPFTTGFLAITLGLVVIRPWTTAVSFAISPCPSLKCVVGQYRQINGLLEPILLDARCRSSHAVSLAASRSKPLRHVEFAQETLRLIAVVVVNLLQL